MNKRVFKNELGNSIELAVSKKEIEGVGGVFISILGPTSETGLHITKMEAEVLNEELLSVLES